MKKRSVLNNIFVKNILGLILVTVILVSAVLIWLNYYTQHGKEVEVPDVKGLSVEAAETFFTKNNLKFVVDDSVFIRNTIPGSIAETRPPVGSMVKKGRTIYLKINSYLPNLIAIPNVVDNSERQSIAMLKSLGFEKIDTKTLPGVYRGLVLGIESRGISLEAGERVPAETPLTLLVSSGTGDVFLLEDSDESIFFNTEEEPSL